MKILCNFSVGRIVAILIICGFFCQFAHGVRLNPGTNFSSPGTGSLRDDLLWNSFGAGSSNARRVGNPALSSDGTWLTTPTFAIEINASVVASPASFGNAIVFPTLDGRLVAANARTGDVLWSADVGVAYLSMNETGKSTIKTTPALWGARYLVVGTSSPARVLVIDVLDGSLLWSVTVDDHPYSQVSGAGTVVGNHLYVGISSYEPFVADTVEGYVCCTFVGSLVKVDLAVQHVLWKTPMIGANVSGVGNFSGAPLIGSTPPVDTDLGLVFVATGKNYAFPETYLACLDVTNPPDVYDECVATNYTVNHANSVLALDTDTGEIVWNRYLEGYVAWELACLRPFPVPNCPEGPGTHFDFGMMPVLGKIPPIIPEAPSAPPPTRRKRAIQVAEPVLWKVIFVGQRSGILWCFKASDGTLAWANQTSPEGRYGGLDRGLATDGELIYYSVTNFDMNPWELLNGTVTCGGGWGANNKTDGTPVWTTSNPATWDPTGPPGDSESNGRSSTGRGGGAPASLGGLVMVTSGDTVFDPDYGSGDPTYGSGGYYYALNSTDGNPLASFEGKAGGVASFSGNAFCAYVGSGYKPAYGYPNGKFVYGWCVT